MPRKRGHLYRVGAEGPERRAFEQRYGMSHGDEVYGATVGKVKREQEAEEDDRPRSGTGAHDVRGHETHVDGRATWVPKHRAKNPRRRG